VSIGEASYAAQMIQSIPYYDKMVSMLSVGQMRPNIAVSADSRHDVYYGKKTPKEALDDAAQRSAHVLGWI